MFEKALTELHRQPDDMQEFVASLILDELENERRLATDLGKDELSKAIQTGLDQLDAGQGLKGQDVIDELKALQTKRRHG